MLSIVVSVLAITVVVVLALVAIRHDAFHENWLQWVGLWGVVFAGVAKIAYMLHFDYVSSRDALFFVAVAAYASGTALKVARHWRRARHAPRAHA